MSEPTGTVVWDVETSGLHRDEHDILSISAACGPKRFTTLCKPTRPIPAEASRINKLYDADFVSAPAYEDAALAFANWVRAVAGPRPLLVAFNGDHFDVPFLIYKNSSIEPSKFPAFDAIFTADPLRVAQQVYTRDQVGGSFRQTSVYKMLFGAEPPKEKQHTSDGDVEALVRIVEHESLCTLVSASARPLHDLTGQHMLAVRRKGIDGRA